MRISELDTPTLLVDLHRLRANLERTAQYARSADLALRPHTKTHKTVEIAKLQMEYGAVGITVAKVGEAEVMVDAGFEDVFIANQIVGQQKLDRLIALARRAKISVGVDSMEVAVPLSAAFVQEGMRASVLIEVDVGLGRCGVQPEAAVELAKHFNALGGLSLVGLFCYAGHVYMARNENEVEGLAAHEARVMGMLAERVGAITGTPLRVSGGSTPTARHYHPQCGLTEMRPGAYVFNDRTQTARWAATPNDCAQTVLATVISVPEAGRAVLDAGSKALCADTAPDQPGYGMLKEDNRAVIVRVNEEHAFLDLTQAALKPRVGDKVEVIPNHCCTVTNMFDEIVAVRAGEVVERWPVAARGRVQ